MSQIANQTGDRIFSFRATSVVMSILMLALSPVGMCQTAPVQEADPPPSETTEEIIVYGKKSMLILREEAYRAAKVAFDKFNSLNSDDEFDIHCYKEASIGSHIMRRVCRPNFVGKLNAEATQSLLKGMPDGGVLARIKQKEKLLQEEMEALAAEHPELQEAISEFIEANQVLDSEHERRCEGAIFACGN